MIKLNFSHPNSKLEGFTNHQLHVDLADIQLEEKIIAYLLPLVGDGSEPVTIVSPGLAHLGLLVLTAIHGLTGHFPLVIAMKKGDDGFFPLPAVNLQEYRNSCVRISREGLTVL